MEVGGGGPLLSYILYGISETGQDLVSSVSNHCVTLVLLCLQGNDHLFLSIPLLQINES